MRVLLFAPVEGVDPPSGDVTYTQALLESPPPGVTYTTYVDAIMAGTVKIRGRRPRWGRVGCLDLAVLSLRGIEKVFRQRKLLFREPWWFATVDEGAFDVVHQHLFAVRQVGSRVPVVASSGYPLTEHYSAQYGWSHWRCDATMFVERVLARILGIVTPWLPQNDGAHRVVYTDHYAAWMIDRGVDPKAITVASTALPPPAKSGPRSGRQGCLQVGFVGRDFRRKGGLVALGAFRVLANSAANVGLTVVTRAADWDPRDGWNGLSVRLDVDRATLLSDVMESLDVLVLPTLSDCGAPYGVIEALQRGIPVVLGDGPWLDARLTGPGILRVDGSETEVVAAISLLLAPEYFEIASAHAKDLGHCAFGMRPLHLALLGAYNTAVDRRRKAWTR